MEVVSNSRANPVNRIMGRAQFDFLPPNIVNPKMLKGIVQERTISLPKSQILGSIGVWYSLNVRTKEQVEGQYRYCDRVAWIEAKTCSDVYKKNQSRSLKVNWFSVSVSSHSSGAPGKTASDSKVPVGETPPNIF